MKNTLAQMKLYEGSGFTGFGPLGNPEGTGITTFSTFLSTAIGVMTIVAFIWFVFVFLTGAISIIGSGGDKQAFEGAKKRITTGLVGVIVIISSMFIISLIGQIFNIPFLDLFQLFYRLTGQSDVGLPAGID